VYVAAARKLGRQPFRLAVSDFLRGHARVTTVTSNATQAAPAVAPRADRAKGQTPPAKREPIPANPLPRFTQMSANRRKGTSAYPRCPRSPWTPKQWIRCQPLLAPARTANGLALSDRPHFTSLV
jgi:hypothetical protein